MVTSVFTEDNNLEAFYMLGGLGGGILTLTFCIITVCICFCLRLARRKRKEFSASTVDNVDTMEDNEQPQQQNGNK